MKSNYKLIALAACLLVLFSFTCKAQNGPIKDRLIISGGMQYIYNDRHGFRNFLSQSGDVRRQYRLQASYGLGRWFTIGAYLGHSFPLHRKAIGGVNSGNGYESDGQRNYILNYGLLASFHPLELIPYRTPDRLDVYGSFNIGGNHVFVREANGNTADYKYHYEAFEFIMFIGTSYYFSPRIGLNLETAFFKHARYNRRFRLAIVYKFGT